MEVPARPSQPSMGIAAILIGFAVLVVFVVVGTSPAHAEPNPYSAVEVCNAEAPGSGYYVQHRFELPGANVSQLYNGTYNCVVTIKRAHVGEPSYTSACIDVGRAGEPNDWKCNSSDKFEYYAGAVWEYGVGMCVRYAGQAGNYAVVSDFDNCG